MHQRLYFDTYLKTCQQVFTSAADLKFGNTYIFIIGKDDRFYELQKNNIVIFSYSFNDQSDCAFNVENIYANLLPHYL
jgi:hypothetical protein